MSWLLVGGGVLLVGGAYLWRRSRGETTPTPKASAEDDCEKLRVFGDEAVTACKATKAAAGAGKAILSLFGAKFTADNDVNVQLNGAVVERVPDDVMFALELELTGSVSGTMATYTDEHYPLQKPFALRYANGFVPVPGHPDFAKGKAGSKSLVNPTWFKHRSAKPASALLSGNPETDALTFRMRDGRGVVKGRILSCPGGVAIDHRVDPPQLVCAATGGPAAIAPSLMTTSVRTSSSTTGTADYRTDPPR